MTIEQCDLAHESGRSAVRLQRREVDVWGATRVKLRRVASENARCGQSDSNDGCGGAGGIGRMLCFCALCGFQVVNLF